MNTIRTCAAQTVVLQSMVNPAIKAYVNVEGYYFISPAIDDGWRRILRNGWRENFVGSSWENDDFCIHSVIF